MTAEPPTALDPLLRSLADDPWALDPAERRRLRDGLQDAQDRWLPRLGALVEPPAIDREFPAFLLETAPFESLRRAVGDARDRHALDTGTADRLQRFVDRYRDYLRDGAAANAGAIVPERR